MLGSLYTSVAGLKGHLVALNVAGNNISNMNSIGFKGSRATFREALVQTLRGATQPQNGLGGISPLQLGLGMGVGSIDNLMSQGVLQTTGVNTDLGISGQGFFILSDGTKEYYSRVGAFGLDGNGNLVNPANGLIVQGRLADGNGVISQGTTLSDITLPFGRKVEARATSEVGFGCNLDASATDSAATLATAGTTGITSIAGDAANGCGGEHAITLTGANATASTLAGANLTSAGALTGGETLASLGVTILDDFSLSVDGKPAVTLTGLTSSSTVNDLVNAINSTVTGVTAKISGGEVVLTRDYAGDGTTYNVASSLGADGNISRQIFGAAAGSAFTVNSGTASTLVATDVFTPTGKAALAPVSLALSTNATTGIVDGITNLGGGGVTVTARDGLAAGDALIDTAPTEHYTSMVVYDSLGSAHNLSVRFTKSPTVNEWYWNASLGGSEQIKGGSSGTITFDSTGALASFSYDGGGTGLAFDPATGAQDVQIDFNPGQVGGYDGVTQFASAFSTAAKTQNGYGMGALTDIAIDASGIITGSFSNGITRPIAQIMLAKFTNPAGLQKVGDGLYQTSSNSGIAVKGECGKVVQGTISSGSLESSNVDLSEEFVNMIVAQRGFQANARVMTASDQMLTDLVNIGR
ncbi:MAG TPA: flagellar hook-basal body complex protein [bacterium]|nr:flagellar hook-basal body complex protein [bacterium]